MQQELRFGLDLGRLAVLKIRVWADYEQLLSFLVRTLPWFFLFQVQKNVKIFKNIVASALKSCIAFLKKIIIFLFWFFIGLETFSIVSCSSRDTSPRDLSKYNEFGCQTLEPDRTKSRCCNFIRLIENPFIEKVGRVL